VVIILARSFGVHVASVRRDLRRVPAAERTGGVAQLALTLAAQMDATGAQSGEVPVDLMDLTSLARQYHAVLATLAKMQAPVVEANPVDELEARRARRRGAS